MSPTLVRLSIVTIIILSTFTLYTFIVRYDLITPYHLSTPVVETKAGINVADGLYVNAKPGALTSKIVDNVIQATADPSSLAHVIVTHKKKLQDSVDTLKKDFEEIKSILAQSKTTEEGERGNQVEL